jgi:beta-galactosidase GanA
LEFVDKAHALGMYAILYHYPRAHAYYGKAQPDWLNRDENGSVVEIPRGHALCINSPWRSVYFGQLAELVTMGADALYIDEFPQPAEGCWCQHCQAAYQAYSGGTDTPRDGATCVPH